MVETDWRKILSLTQKELNQSEKETLCESLSWMEADDIELNFSDLKTLFRLSQDILKYKNEQVNNLLGQLETTQRKIGRKKLVKASFDDSSPQSADSVFETITHQEELIKANKEIIEQLYSDIAELEDNKSRLEKEQHEDTGGKDSDSSRDPISEMAAVDQLEGELLSKNRHIRKLLIDIKVSEEENAHLKSKTSVLKEKLSEATNIIKKLTKQIYTLNSECSKLKDALGRSEEKKSQLEIETETLKQHIAESDSDKNTVFDELRSKVQHWKNIVRSTKAENEALTNENLKLRDDLVLVIHKTDIVKSDQTQEEQMKELQEKLTDATKEIIHSAKLIELLKAENKKFKAIAEETPDYSMFSELNNENDEGKEKTLIRKLKKKVNSLTVHLKDAEEIITFREKELTDLRTELQLLQSEEEGISTLVEGLKSKKLQLKLKDEGIKSLVQEINKLNQLVDELQLENETMRQKLNINADTKIPVKGILKKFHTVENNLIETKKKIQRLENNFVNLQLEKRICDITINKLKKALLETGCNEDHVKDIINNEDQYIDDGGGDGVSTNIDQTIPVDKTVSTKEAEMQAIAEENEGLRKGLQEILDFLKDSNTGSSGTLALQCPSLEAVLRCMEARHAAGWFAPHMAVVLELRAALGGRDALLTALHNARKETFDIMTELKQESHKSLELENKLREIESKTKSVDTESQETSEDTHFNDGIFGSWMADNDIKNINFHDKIEIENLVTNKNVVYEAQLKGGLEYFYKKFKVLYQKMTEIAIQATDEQNKWSIQEDNYKADIENLKTQLTQKEDDDKSDPSPGMVDIYPNLNCLQRKCGYLEESYKYVRTLNENIKNEHLDYKRDAMLLFAEYENQIQNLILKIVNVTDKFRNSVSIDLFLKQNEALQDVTTKYRKLLEQILHKDSEYNGLYKKLEEDRIHILNSCQKQHNGSNSMKSKHKTFDTVEQSILHKQLETVCNALDDEITKVKDLERIIEDLQLAENKLIDSNMAIVDKQEVHLLKEQLEKIVIENKALKEQCQHVSSQLDIALLQLQDRQQKQMNYDLEINMMRHQILDLQSIGDNKAIIARLSGEILITHLQASDSHKKIERLHAALIKEKQTRIEAEEMLRAREKIFDVYASRYESKFRYMVEVMNTLRQQYQGSLPLISLENYLNAIEDVSRKSRAVDDKLNEVEDLRTLLIAKHNVFDELLEVTKFKCLVEDEKCPRVLQKTVNDGIHSRELDHCNKKIAVLEHSRKELMNRCNILEKTLILINQGFDKLPTHQFLDRKDSGRMDEIPDLQLEDLHSDEEQASRKSQTITLPKPQVLKAAKPDIDMTNTMKPNDTAATLLPGSPIKDQSYKQKTIVEKVDVLVQTIPNYISKRHIFVQTDIDKRLDELRSNNEILRKDNHIKSKELSQALSLANQRSDDIMSLKTKSIELEAKIKELEEVNLRKDNLSIKLQNIVTDLNTQILSLQKAEKNKAEITASEETKSLLLALKKIESDKNMIVEEYKEMLKKERDEYAKNMKDNQKKVMDLKAQLSRNSSESSNTEAIKEIVSKYTVKIVELEDKNFKLQSNLDGCRTEMSNYQSELERWKLLAAERLNNMEHLNGQLEERHSHEVASYKAENQHWLTQLNENQRDHMELRSKLSEQRATYVRQLADKDAHIEHMRTVIHNLKTQVMNLQTLISVNDPSFDLSAIIEVDENSDMMSQQGSDRLEIKFDSTLDFQDFNDDALAKGTATSTAIWQEPLVERLRREKQLTGKQNAILRRQIKALAGRERRARLETQNLKNQVYRISTSGSKAATAEAGALHGKIASLQVQLASARRDTQNGVALWDKWKRSQQAAERWQARYEEKCREVKKLEVSLNFTKSAVTRLEREKRVLLTKLADNNTNEKPTAYEKREEPEKELCEAAESEKVYGLSSRVSVRALVERVEAQQRRIVALELAEKGNETLVREYEKALAEITSLKGQVLKLESSVLESQIRSPMLSGTDPQPELEYWKSYCEMLKEENMQLSLKLSSAEVVPVTSHHQRVNDLEQTVLTLRGLVSKLQSEQKTLAHKRVDSSRPNSGSVIDKGRNQLETYRTEIANLKRSMSDKDLLLEKSKEMLKIAAEREEDLLRENAYLRYRLSEVTKSKGGFLSA